MSEITSKNGKPLYTHRAWIKKTELMRKGRRIGPWIDEGAARIDPDGDVSWVYLHSLPVGGFDGRICIARNGIDPNDMPAPRRPGEVEDEEVSEHDGSDDA